ncbi:hypothetical protein ACWGM1_20410 (plasmid) [Sphingomonas zeae]
MDLYSLPSVKTSGAMEMYVRSVVDTIQTEYGVSAGAIFFNFMLVLLDIDRADVTKHMSLYHKILHSQAKTSDLLKVLGSYAGKR